MYVVLIYYKTLLYVVLQNLMENAKDEDNLHLSCRVDQMCMWKILLEPRHHHF